ncbi:NUDIX domain-containing protein, partial [Patescibacteria group bacterium]|nr:NUDIX domain-containing protein [Patescibacteria group bacterium]
SLSKQGKIVAAKLDTDTHQFEKQPKIGVLVIPRKRESNKNWFLVQQRRKEPYFGYWGFMTGKVRWGETLAETVARELEEETGLSGDWKFCYELHEMVYDKNTNEMLEDKFFHIAEVRKVRGELQQTKDGFNKWVTIDEFKKMSPKYHNEDDILNWYLNKDFTFKEEKYYIERF